MIGRGRQGKRSSRTRLAAGDLLVRTSRLRAVIGAAEPRPGHQERRGQVVDLAPGRLHLDALEALVTQVEIEGRRRSIVVRDVRRIVRGRRPVVRVEGHAGSGTSRVSVVSEIGAGASDRSLGIRTVLGNEGRKALRVRLADVVTWGDGPAFAPRVGEALRWREETVPWFARAADGVTYAWVWPEGDVQARFAVEQTGSQKLFLGVTARLPDTSIAPGGRAVFSRRLVAVAGDLGEAAAVAWRLRGEKVRTIRGRAPGLGDHGHLLVEDQAGSPVLDVSVGTDGRFAAPLPEGTYRLVAQGHGRRPTPRTTVRVGAGEPYFVELAPPEAPGRVDFSVLEKGGTGAVPCRLVFRGWGDTPDPDLGPDGHAAGSRFVVHAASCLGSLHLPAGRYRVSASHGPEWTVLSELVDVHPGDGVAFSGELEHVVRTPRHASADLHVHANPSPDSPVSLVDRVVSLVAEGVEIAVATDHNQVTDYGPAIVQIGMRDRILGIPGDEVTTGGTRFGHFNVFPLPPSPWEPEESVLPYRDVTPGEIFRAARDAPFAREVPAEYLADSGSPDAGPDASANAGPDASANAGVDASANAGADAGANAGADAGAKAGPDAGAGADGGVLVVEDLGEVRVIQVNHPTGEEGIGYFTLTGLDTRTGTASNPAYDGGYDLVEVWNGVWLGDPVRVQASLRDQFELWNLGFRYVATGNSDSHRLYYQWAGWPRNYVEVGEVSVAALTPAAVMGPLRDGHVFVTSGPIVYLTVDGATPGSTVVPQGGKVDVGIRIEAAPWVDVTRVDVVQSGTVRETIAVPSNRRRTVRLDTRRRYEVDSDSWISLVVRGEAPAPEVYVFQAVTPFAFTNPVWIDADGDGLWQ